MSEFSSALSEIKALDAEGEELFNEYSKCDLDFSADLETAISANLERRAESVRKLYEIAYAPQASPTYGQQASRFGSNLELHKKTFKKLKSNISQERTRQQLLSNVRQDIQSHRSTTQLEQDADAERYYASEQQRIGKTSNIAEQILQGALNTRDELQRQQRLLSGVGRRMSNIYAQFPNLNTIIGKIHSRKRKNSLILGLVIFLCVLFIYFVR